MLQAPETCVEFHDSRKSPLGLATRMETHVRLRYMTYYVMYDVDSFAKLIIW